jgi:signal transduction histidine kinase
MHKQMMTLVLAATALCGTLTWAGEKADKGTKDEAIAMVKKAAAAIKEKGADKTFELISNKDAQFVDRDLYVIVYDMNGKCLAHGANAKKVGRDLIDDKDVDGKPFMRERVEMMKKQDTGWQDYKFKNPVSNQIEDKSTYLEKHGDVIIGCGIYKQ